MSSNFLIGVRTDKFVILAADSNAYLFNAIKISKEHCKEFKLGERMYMVCSGELGDIDSFANWAKANIDLYQRRYGYELRPKSVQHWLRKSVADNLRSQDMWQVNSIIGAYDPIDKKAYLTLIDYLACNIPCQNYIFYGFPGNFAYAIMDSFYRPDLTEQEGLELVQRLVDETKRRVIFDISTYRAIVINAEGARTIDGLKPNAEL